jgi:hypothetical protein
MAHAERIAPIPFIFLPSKCRLRAESVALYRPEVIGQKVEAVFGPTGKSECADK